MGENSGVKPKKPRDGCRLRGKVWYIRYDAPGPNGQRHQREEATDAKTRKEARAIRAERQGEVRKGHFIEPTHLTVAAHLENWLAARDVRPKTLAGYRTAARSIAAHVGDVLVQELRPDHVQYLQAQLQTVPRQRGEGVGLAPATRRLVYIVLSAAMEQAADLGIIRVNPCKKVKPPKAEHPEMESLTQAQAATLVPAAGTEAYGTATKLTLFTGLRRSELVGLQWPDLDLGRGKLTVNRGLHWVKGAAVVERPKSKTGRRTIDLDAETVASLRAWRAGQNELRLKAGELWGGAGWVFTNEIGRHLMPDSLSHWYARLARTLQVPTSFHALRHTHATLMLRAGVPVHVVSRRLGHSSPSITLSIYAHVLEGQDAEAAERGARAIRGAM